MGYFKGNTVKEAIGKAIHGDKPVSKQNANNRSACAGLKNDIHNIGNLVRAQESHMRTLQSDIDRMQREQRNLLLHLAVDLAVIVLPIAKALRILRLIDRALELYYTAAAADYVEAAIELILDVIGVLDGYHNLMRFIELPSELNDVRDQIVEIRGELDRSRRELEQALSRYQQLDCAMVDQSGAIV